VLALETPPEELELDELDELDETDEPLLLLLLLSAAAAVAEELPEGSLALLVEPLPQALRLKQAAAAAATSSCEEKGWAMGSW
jgi:hypothetical protein